MGISIDPYDPLTGALAESNQTSRKPSNELDKDAFLNLLVTQMRYQDPLDPMDDSQFISQLAQLTQVEQLTNLNNITNATQAYGMIGKTIDGYLYNQETGTTDRVIGVVTSVSSSGGNVMLTVGSQQIALENVVGVYADYMDNIVSLGITQQQALTMIGKVVQAVVQDEDGNSVLVEGKVDYMKTSGTVTVLVVGNKEIYPSEVMTVSEDNLLIGKTVKYVDGGVTKTGTVEGAKIIDDQAYVVIDGLSLPIEYITDVTDALRYIGKEVKLDDGSTDTVDHVLVKDGNVYVVTVGGDEVEISKLLEE